MNGKFLVSGSLFLVKKNDLYKLLKNARPEGRISCNVKIAKNKELETRNQKL